MEFLLTNAHLLIGGFIFILAFVLAFAGFLDYREQKGMPLLHRFSSDYGRSLSRQGSVLEYEEWIAGDRDRLKARERGEATPHGTE